MARFLSFIASYFLLTISVFAGCIDLNSEKKIELTGQIFKSQIVKSPYSSSKGEIYYILKISDKICLNGKDKNKQNLMFDEIQLYSFNNLNLELYINKFVNISSDTFFEPETSHHHKPLIIGIEKLLVVNEANQSNKSSQTIISDEIIAALHKEYALKKNFGQLKKHLNQLGAKLVGNSQCNGRLKAYVYDVNGKNITAYIFCAGNYGDASDIEAIIPTPPMPIKTNNQNMWQPYSKTAKIVTGPILLSNNSLTAANNTLSIKLFATIGNYYDGYKMQRAEIYQLTPPSDPILLNGNQLCGGINNVNLKWIAIVKSNNQLYMAAFKDGEMPVNETGGYLCGIYYYTK